MAARMKRHGQWKDVKVDPNIFLQDDFANFVCMQELTEYTLTDSSGKIISNDKKKNKKKKASKDKQTTSEVTPRDKKRNKKKTSPKETCSEESPEPDPTWKKTKKIKRKNKKKTQSKKTDKADGSGKTSSSSGDAPPIGGEKKVNKKKKGSVSTDSIDASEQVGSDEERTADRKFGQRNAKKRKSSEAAPKVTKKQRSNISSLEVTDVEDPDQPAEPEPSPEPSPDMSAWQDLFVPEPVLRALSERGFTSPTPIQALVLPSAIRDHMDIVGAAETGSGKTLAFGIPLIHRILELKAQKATNQEPASDDSEGDREDKEDGLMHVDESYVGSVDGESEITERDILDSDNEGSDTSASEDSDQGEPPKEPGIMEKIMDGGESDSEGSLEGSEGLLEGSPEGTAHDNDDLEDMGEEFWEQPSTVVTTYQRPLYALILTPTRELAMQVKDHLVTAAKYTDIQVVPIVGGMAQPKQLRLLRRCPEIVVATPGRLWELLQMGEPHLSKVCGVSCLVIDEADRMVEKGHFQELSQLLVMMNRDERKSKRRTYVFSATLTFVHSGPERFKYAQKKKKTLEKLSEKQKLEMLMTQIGVKPKPKVIDLSRSSGTAESLTEARINTTTEEKDVYLYYFLRQYPGRTLVFANSKDCIRRLVGVFKLLQCCPLPLHADMHQRQRLKNLDRFKGNPRGLLLATDVAARGLDIPDVQHVIHYQVPRTTENYVHRSGRTARATKEGLSVMLIGPDDVSYYRKILHNLNRNEDLPLFPIDQDTLSNIKIRVNLARDIDKQEHRLNKKVRDNNWYEKAAKEMDIMLDDNDKLLNDLGDHHEQSQAKHKLASEKRELSFLLQQSVQNRYSGKYPTWAGNLPQKTQTIELSGAISRVKEEHKQNQRMMSQHKITQPNREEKKREKQMMKKKKKKKL